MLMIFYGPSCSGKSAVAEQIREKIGLTVWTGKEYLKLAKNSNQAWNEFCQKLELASSEEHICSDSIIYVVSEESVINDKNVQKLNYKLVQFIADLAILKKRFQDRIKAPVLPKGIEMMIEKQLQKMSDIQATLSIDTSNTSIDEIVTNIITTFSN